MREIHFDVSQINKIHYYPEENLGLVRIPRTPQKNFWGNDSKRYFREPGWGKINKEGNPVIHYFDEDLEGERYKMTPDGPAVKPVVYTHLFHGDYMTMYFETNEKAVEWLESLKSKSGKTYEVIYNKAERC